MSVLQIARVESLEPVWIGEAAPRTLRHVFASGSWGITVRLEQPSRSHLCRPQNTICFPSLIALNFGRALHWPLPSQSFALGLCLTWHLRNLQFIEPQNSSQSQKNVPGGLRLKSSRLH